MQKRLRRQFPTEILDPSSGSRVFGRLAHADAGYAAVTLGAGNAPAWLRPAAHVVVSAAPESGLHRAEGRVWTIDRGVVWLYLGRGRARPRARKHVRRPCTMPVAVRFLRTDGIAGAWLTATSVDVSLGGLAVTLAADTELTARAELRFLLPNEIAEAEAASRASDDQIPARHRRPIAVLGRLAYVKKIPGDLALVGFEFMGMKGQDRMRVAAFAHGSATASRSAA